MTTTLLQLALLVASAYLMGAIPNGLLVGSLMGRDLLRHGSGKTGTANTMRVLGRPAAVAVFALDLAKGALAVIMARLLLWSDDAWLGIAVGSAASAAIIGHNWSAWVRILTGRWGGGRGIVTALGAMLLVHPLVVLGAVIAGGIALIASRYVVVGTLVGVLGGITAAGLLVALQQLSPWFLPGIAAWCALITLGFADSIERLRKGTETRLGG